jgi:hypothetical protein
MAEENRYETMWNRQTLVLCLIVGAIGSVVIGAFLAFTSAKPWLWLLTLVPPVVLPLFFLLSYGVGSTLRLHPKLQWVIGVPYFLGIISVAVTDCAGFSHWIWHLIARILIGAALTVALAMGIYGWWHRPKKVNP